MSEFSDQPSSHSELGSEDSLGNLFADSDEDDGFLTKTWSSAQIWTRSPCTRYFFVPGQMPGGTAGKLSSSRVSNNSSLQLLQYLVQYSTSVTFLF